MRYIKKYNDFFLFENYSLIKTEYQLNHLNNKEKIEYFTARLNDFKDNGANFMDYELDLCPLKIRNQFTDVCIEKGYGITNNMVDEIRDKKKKEKYIISNIIFYNNKLTDYTFSELSDDLKDFYIERLIKYNNNHKNQILYLTDYQYENCSKDVIIKFFPALFNLEGDKDLQMKNKDVLPREYEIKLLQNIYKTTNKLLISVLIEDIDDANMCISNKQRARITKLDNNKITFKYSPTYEIDQLNDILDLWKDRKKYSISYLEGDLEDFDYTNILDKVIKEYYDNNQVIINNNIGNISYNIFSERYFEDFSEDDGVKSGIKSTIVSKSDDEYEKECQTEIDAIVKYIDIEKTSDNKHEVSLKINYFIDFILENNIENIDNVNTFVIEYVEKYCNYSDDTSPYASLDTDVSYTDEDIKKAVDNFFDSKFNEVELTPEQKEANMKYSKILNKYFTNNVFDSDYINIKINYFEVEELIVNVNIKFKKTGKKYNGFIEVDQLINYITHEDLFD